MINYSLDPVFIEKRKIKKTANAIGGAFLIGWGATFIMSVISSVSSVVMTLFNSGELIESDLYMWLLQIVFSAFMFTVPFIVMTVPMNTRVSVVCKFSRPKKGYILPLTLIGCGVCMVANVLGSFTTSFFDFLGFGDSSSTLVTDPNGGWIYPVLSILGGAVLPALVEEFALRGIVLGALRKFGNGFAIIASASLFGLMHGTFSQIPFAFILGLYFGYITVKTESILPAMLLHFINNACSFALDMLSTTVSQNAYGVTQMFYFIFMLVLSFVGVKILGGRDLSIQDEKTNLTTGQKLRAASGTPCIILSFIYIGLEMLLMQLVA